jgi:hypothetical protein
MPEYSVVFENRELGSSNPISTVTGISGKLYARARFSREGYHLSEPLTLAQYEAAKVDISRAWHRPMCRWVPRFVVVEDKKPEPVAGGTAPTSDVLKELNDLKYFSLTARAKKLGVNTKGLNRPAIIKAILANG